MNRKDRYFRNALPVCPKCGMDGGKRLVSDTVPEKYFVICEVCGFQTKPHVTQSAATKEWSCDGKNSIMK